MQVRNHVTLIGNLGSAPKVMTFENGTRMAEFSLATNDSYKDRDGNRVTRTEWHQIRAFGKVADVLDRYLHTGSKIAVSGTIRYNKWIDKYEQNRTTAQIILEDFTFLDGKDSDEKESRTERRRESRVMVAAEPTPPKRATKTGGSKRKKAAARAEDLPF